MENVASKIGLAPKSNVADAQLRKEINLKLAAIGCPTAESEADDNGFGNLAESMPAHNPETARLLADYSESLRGRIGAQPLK